MTKESYIVPMILGAGTACYLAARWPMSDCDYELIPGTAGHSAGNYPRQPVEAMVYVTGLRNRRYRVVRSKPRLDWDKLREACEAQGWAPA
jgi:hypothetical protein